MIAPLIVRDGKTTPEVVLKVPELEIKFGVDPKLLLLAADKVPAVILTELVKLFDPLRVNVPDPDLVMPPDPEITPNKFKLLLTVAIIVEFAVTEIFPSQLAPNPFDPWKVPPFKTISLSKAPELERSTRKVPPLLIVTEPDPTNCLDRTELSLKTLPLFIIVPPL